MSTSWIGRLSGLLLGGALLSASLLTSCGGGVGSGGTGAMAGGYGVGTITGFGSVIVDGRRYDDAGARIEYDTEADAPDVPSRRLERLDLAEGQRVELVFELDGEARRASVFRISPALVGPVTSLAPLSVAGQVVRLNADPARGPVTRFGGGLASAGQIVLGERLEVHGVMAAEGSGAAIRATRVERRPDTHGKWLRLTGEVSALAADGRSFRLGALKVSLPERLAGRTALENGQRVQVWTREGVADNRLVADRLRLVASRHGGQEAVQLSGVPEACPDRPRASHVCVGRLAVALDGARYEEGLSAANLSGWPYVIVSGRFDPDSGAVTSARFAVPGSR